MGLFSKTIEGRGWSLDKKSGALTISGEAYGFEVSKIKAPVRSVTALPGSSTRYGSTMFSDMKDLAAAELSELDVSGSDSLFMMFKGCQSLTDLDLTHWNVENIKDAGYMFDGCCALKHLDLSPWNVSNIKNLGFMFLDCSSLETLDLTGWEIGEGADADNLFTGISPKVRIFTDDVSVVRLLPEGMKPEPHGTPSMRFNTALALDNAGDYAEAARQYELAAQQGSPSSAWNLSILHGNGKGVEKSETERFRWQLKAAELGHAIAMSVVARSLNRGDLEKDGTEQDRQQALVWAKKAKESGGLPEDIKIDDLIRLIENNIAFDAARAASKAEDYEEAARQYQIAMEKGSSAAAWNLGLLYTKGQGVPADPAEGFRLSLRAAEMGNARAMYSMAKKFHSGDKGLIIDDEQALIWAEKAEESGKLNADTPIGDLIREIKDSLKNDPYDMGKAECRPDGDYAWAVKQFKLAVEQGNASAAWILGSIYTKGEGREKDEAEGFRWYLKAAEMGLGEAMYTVAEAYFFGGPGTKKDDEQALYWAKKAKESIVLSADKPVDKLIRKIENNIAFPKAAAAIQSGDHDEALQSLTLLTEQGSAAAALLLAKLHIDGDGVDLDRDLALHYYAIASENGNTDASSYLVGQDVEDMYREVVDAYERGDRTAALHAYHAAYRADIIRAYHGFASSKHDMTFYRKLIEASADLLSEEGNSGTPWANYYLGRLYWKNNHLHRHIDVPEDPYSAVPPYKKALEAGCDQALTFMAVRNYYGDCSAVPQDRAKAALLLSWAAQSDDPEVRYEAACRYMTGYPEKKSGETVYMDKEPEKAIGLMTALAEEGHTGAMFTLSQMYASDNADFPNDPDKRLEYAKRAAELGHLTAIQSMDSIEKSVEEDKLKARIENWIRRGDMYYYGTERIKPDIFSAIDNYEKAAEYDAGTAYKLGEIFYYGKGIHEDKEEALRWFMHGAELGHVQAQLYTGEMYYNGDGIPLDYTEAAKWYTKAAENGKVTAQYNMGIMYKCGQGVSQDEYRAKKWFEKAAEHNYAAAYYELGCIHNNKIIDVNPTCDYYKSHYSQAKEYFQKAAELGSEDAKRALRMSYY